MNRYYNPSLISSIVAGALTSYDLPDITACIAPRKLLMINIADQSNNEASSELIEKEMQIARSAYAIAGSKENLIIKSQVTEECIEALLSSWLE